MGQNFKILIFFLIIFTLLVIFYSFYSLKTLPTPTFLAQVAGLPREEEKVRSEIDLLKEKINDLEGKINEIGEGINQLVDFKKNFEKLSKKVDELKRKEEKEGKENFCQISNSQAKLEVIFNEICWMGDENSPANEWIELKNLSGKEINLKGWQIFNKDQKIRIFFEKEIKLLPNEILILTRGDDFTGAIKNSNEILFLFDKDCYLEDKVEATSTWPAGDHKTKRTMERKKDLSWQTSEYAGGTPGRENSRGLVILEKREKEEKIEPKISLNYPSQIFSQKEFEVLLSVSDLKYDTFDLKISILKQSEESEEKRTISEISIDGNEWQDSYRYLNNIFTGTSFGGKFKLRIPQEFSGEAEILAKIRDKNKKIVVEFSNKIEVIKGKEKLSLPTETSLPTQSKPETFSSQPVPLSLSTKILISEVAAGWDKAENEFIELYNPNDFDILISDQYFKLKLLNSSNQMATKRINWINNIIPAKNHFLLIGGQILIDGQILEPDATFSSQLTDVSGVIITDGQETVIDKVGWGTQEKPPPREAIEKEGVVLEKGLKTGQSLERINFQDTDNNSQDFQLQLTPNPKNSKSK